MFGFGCFITIVSFLAVVIQAAIGIATVLGFIYRRLIMLISIWSYELLYALIVIDRAYKSDHKGLLNKILLLISYIYLLLFHIYIFLRD